MAAKPLAVSESYEVLQRFSQRPPSNDTAENFVGSLHRLIHSTHASCRKRAVELLEGLGEPDRTKELIQFYDDCMWRESKLAVLEALGSDASPRGIEFLIGVASNGQDLGLAKAALEALARSATPQAAHFLIGRFETPDDPLLPYIVYGLGRMHIDLARPLLYPALVSAVEPECPQPLLAQALIFTIAAQRIHEAVPLLLRLCARTSLQRSVRQSALFSLQELGQDPAELSALASAFSDTFFDRHLLASAVRKTELRRAMTLEDVIEKLAEPLAELGLARELDRFAPEDVEVGLDLFFQACPEPQKLSRILRHCNHPGAHARYLPLLRPEAALEDLLAVLSDVAYHVDAAFEPAFEALLPRARADVSGALFDALCTAAVHALPEGPGWVLSELESHGRDLGVRHWLCAVNRVTQRLLAQPQRTGRFAQDSARVAALLESNEDTETRGRILRACGQLGYSERSVWRHVERALKEPALRGSALVYLEQCPNQRAARLLAPAVDDVASFESASWGAQILLFRAIRAQRRLPDNWPALDSLLTRAIGGEWGTGALVRALSVLAEHPRPALSAPVVALSRSEPLDHQVWLWAIVALRSLAPPEATSVLAAWLRSDDSVASESVRGRALDALCALDDDDARGQVVAFLAENMQDMEVCEKVIRCLTPPKSQRRQLTGQLGQLLKNHPDHPLHDALSALRDRMLYDYGPQDRRTPPSAELTQVDTRLEASMPGYVNLSHPIKAAIRGAELPYLHRELYSGEVDKSVCVMGYCKAIDLLLLERLGHRLFFSKLRERLSAFQNVLFALGIQEDEVEVVDLHAKLNLGNQLLPDDLPAKKIRRICRSISQGTILRDSWVIDGLSAWAVVLILFVRGEGTARRNFYPILLPKASDQDILELSNALLQLHAGRNQAAHRETFVEFVDVSRLRAQSLKIVRGLDALFNAGAP